MLRLRPFVAALAAVLAGCASSAPAVAPGAGGEVAVTILHLNDVYEVTPVEAGRAGGLARVAALRQRLLAENPRTITVLAGDYLSPSALGTARVDGQRLAGRQMTAVLNAVGLDVAALGNHEFDLAEADFRARMAEARFPNLAANAAPPPGSAPWPGVRASHVVPLALAPGDTLRVAFVSAVIPSTVRPYVVYTEPVAALAAEAARVAPRADVLVALTHLAFDDDARVAETVPGVHLVLGGHEHDNVLARRGARRVPIAKADANARTVWVHRLAVDRSTGAVRAAHELVFVDETLPADPAVAAEVARWTDAGFAGFRADGFEPERVVATLAEALDGRESTVRTRAAPLGTRIAEGFLAAARSGGAPAEAALFNSGSVRIDDVLPAGPFTEYDAIRVLPFGGDVVSVRLPGALLARVLDVGVASTGTGAFLQSAGIEALESGWAVGGQPLDPARVYTVATSDFLVSGREQGMDFFSPDASPELRVVGRHGDVRRALIDALQNAR